MYNSIDDIDSEFYTYDNPKLIRNKFIGNIYKINGYLCDYLTNENYYDTDILKTIKIILKTRVITNLIFRKIMQIIIYRLNNKNFSDGIQKYFPCIIYGLNPDSFSLHKII